MNPFFSRCLVIALGTLALYSQRGLADEIITGEPDLRHQPVFITSVAVKELMVSPGVEIREVTQEELFASASAHGVTLPSSALDHPGGSDRPWMIVKTGVGLPATISAELEVYVHPHVSVAINIGSGVPSDLFLFMGSVTWHPDATCWGCDGKDPVALGFGLNSGIVTTPTQTDPLITGSMEFQYMHRFAEHYGWVMGLRPAAGPVWDHFIGQQGSPAEYDFRNTKPHLALTFFLFIGFSF